MTPSQAVAIIRYYRHLLKTFLEVTSLNAQFARVIYKLRQALNQIGIDLRKFIHLNDADRGKLYDLQQLMRAHKIKLIETQEKIQSVQRYVEDRSHEVARWDRNLSEHLELLRKDLFFLTEFIQGEYRIDSQVKLEFMLRMPLRRHDLLWEILTYFRRDFISFSEHVASLKAILSPLLQIILADFSSEQLYQKLNPPTVEFIRDFKLHLETQSQMIAPVYQEVHHMQQTLTQIAKEAHIEPTQQNIYAFNPMPMDWPEPELKSLPPADEESLRELPALRYTYSDEQYSEQG